MTSPLLGWIVIVFLALAGLMQIAVIRDRTIHVKQDAVSCRLVVTAGLWGLAFRFTYLVIDGHFAVPWHSLFCIGLIGVGVVGLELPRFVPNPWAETQPSEPVPLDEYQWKDANHDR